jgi:hypothetical protein
MSPGETIAEWLMDFKLTPEKQAKESTFRPLACRGKRRSCHLVIFRS